MCLVLAKQINQIIFIEKTHIYKQRKSFEFDESKPAARFTNCTRSTGVYKSLFTMLSLLHLISCTILCLLVFNVPDSTVVKTEPLSPKEMITEHEFSLYEVKYKS